MNKRYYFFRLHRFPDDPFPEYRIAESVDDLYFRFGGDYMSQFTDVFQLNEVTPGHISAIASFLSYYNFS